MIPTSGVFSLDDANVEIGNSSGAFTNLSSILSTMGETTDPDSMGEMRGYDKDWDDGTQGWIQGIGRADPNPPDTGTLTNWIYLKPHNYSQEHSYSATLYWKTTLNGTDHNSGSFSTDTISANSDGTEQSVDSFKGTSLSDGDEIKLYAMADSSGTYQLVGQWLVAS